MQRFAYQLVDVFTRDRFGGNPLAVFSDAQGLDPALMQRFAFELNLSESTFVLPATRGDCDVRVRIFTPRRELPMAGHPVVGTAFVLEHEGRAAERVRFELGVGPTSVERVVGPDGGPIWRMQQPRPRFGTRVGERKAAAAALGLAPADVADALPIESVATGMPFVMLELASLDALARVRLDAAAWSTLGAPADDAVPYLFVRTGPATVRARMFAPGEGIAEDPATGSAAGPLGAFLLARGALAPDAGGVARLEVEQGVEMGRPSRIFVEAEGAGEDVRAVRVGGAAVSVGGGWLEG
ncbi:MAG TPA: PhzF family phenazine biosynthesis protein [Myxococcota bacterium]|nr:PhzF family phenazine biosynthesis protein [Myxococcota bacterium]